MAFSVRKDRLHLGREAVTLIPSRFDGGAFAATPRIAVIHFTYGGSGRSSAEWFRDSRNPGSSAHVVIDRDGTCFQCVGLDRVAWHAGASRLRDLVGLNRHSFGIELANWGYLKRQGEAWASHTGLRIQNAVVARHRNGNPDGSTAPIGWEAYPEEQVQAAAGVTRALVEAFGVEEIVGHDDISPGRKWDPGPAFDMARFRALVFGERAADADIRRRVASAEGLNLRAGPGTQFAAKELLPDGTEVEPIEQDGLWVSVSVIGADGRPRATGWVHGRYLTG